MSKRSKVILAVGIAALVVILLGVQCQRKRAEKEFNDALILLAQYGYMGEEATELARQNKMLSRMFELEKLADAFVMVSERNGIKLDKDTVRAEMKAKHFPDLP